MEEKQLLDKLWETYELSHEAAKQHRVEIESVPKASRRIGELKRAISSLGSINLGAIEEYQRSMNDTPTSPTRETMSSGPRGSWRRSSRTSPGR